MIIYCLISIFELYQLKVEETFKFGEFFKQWVFVSAATQYIGSQRQASIALYPPIMCSLLTAPDFVIYVVQDIIWHEAFPSAYFLGNLVKCQLQNENAWNGMSTHLIGSLGYCYILVRIP